jgi:fructosamine-3-kinase
MNKALLSHIEAELQTRITKTEQVFGGDINETFVLHSSHKKLFLKLNSIERSDMFEKEFKGLTILRAANAIAIPEPSKWGLFEKQIYLVMEYIEKGSTSPDFWRIFAQQLAALHLNTSDHFGLDHENYIGSLHQQNKQCNSWAEFYAEQRILFLIRMAFDSKKCDISDCRLAEKLCNKFDDLFPKEPPSLLHGDLWSGNYMIGNNGKPVIYDPAVYYGHREMDLGMMLLFGGFENSIYDFYNESFSLEKSWRSRVDLTQLYPLLVHLNLFGGHYYDSVRTTLKKYN